MVEYFFEMAGVSGLCDDKMDYSGLVVIKNDLYSVLAGSLGRIAKVGFTYIGGAEAEKMLAILRVSNREHAHAYATTHCVLYPLNSIVI